MSPAPEPKNDPSFYLALQNLSKFTADTKEIRSIVRAHVRSCLSDKEVEVTTFFRPTKLSTRFSTRSRLSDAERSGVVYSFSCPETSCSAVYTGHTTQALKNRISQHRRVESSICKHFHNDHDKPVPNLDSFSNCFRIVYAPHEPVKIKIVEALTIKNDRPYINVQYDSLNTFLRLF